MNKIFVVFLKRFLPFMLIIGIITSCSDKVKPINEEEVINKVILTLKDNSNNTFELSYNDYDGNGPLSPIIYSDSLPSNTVLNGSIRLRNTLATPEKDITIEVREEGTEHQFFYLINRQDAPTFKYSDQDLNNNPIGIEVQCMTKTSFDGILKIVLRHQPNKSASGVANGDISSAGGSTDVDIEIPIIVK